MVISIIVAERIAYLIGSPHSSGYVYLVPRQYHHVEIISRGDYISLDDDRLGYIVKIYIKRVAICIVSLYKKECYIKKLCIN